MDYNPIQTGGVLRANWSAHKAPFDFDAVEIVQTTDEQIERFVVQIGNDTRPGRQARLKTIPCRIAPNCDLSENSLRILGHTFAHVERQADHEP